MLAKIAITFPSDDPKTSVVGGVVDTSNWPNARMLFEQRFLVPISAADAPPGNEESAALRLQAEADSAEKLILLARIAALEKESAKLTDQANRLEKSANENKKK